MTDQRVAILVDGDNVSAAFARQILNAAKKLGRVDVAQVFGACNAQNCWGDLVEFQFVYAGDGKNAADQQLTVEAMELALAEKFDNFLIASSDSDYTHLARRLRKYGCHVLCMGEEKTNEKLRAAASKFTVLMPKAKTPKPKVDAKKTSPSLDEKIRAMIFEHSQKGRGMPIAALGQQMHQIHSVQISEQPEKSWRAYLTKRPTLFECDPRGPDANVRFLPSGFTPQLSIAAE